MLLARSKACRCVVSLLVIRMLVARILLNRMEFDIPQDCDTQCEVIGVLNDAQRGASLYERSISRVNTCVPYTTLEKPGPQSQPLCTRKERCE